MDSNTYSVGQPAGLAASRPRSRSRPPRTGTGSRRAVRAERVLGLRRLLDRLEGRWLRELAGGGCPGDRRRRDGWPTATPPPPDQRAPTATPVPGGWRGSTFTRALKGPVLERHTR